MPAVAVAVATANGALDGGAASDPHVLSLPSVLGVSLLRRFREGWVDAAVEPGQRRLKVAISGAAKCKESQQAIDCHNCRCASWDDCDVDCDAVCNCDLL